jgi:hypothetical protein
MLKQMMKLAGARNEKEFLKMFPTEASFLRKHGGEMMYMYGGSYADGGTPQDQQAMMMQQQAGQQQGQPSQDQMMQQIVQFIMQSLQQGAAPEQILQKLVEQGIPQEQATQLLQAVLQKVEEQQGAQSQQPGMEQQMSPEEQMMMQQQGQQMGMAYGGVLSGTPEEEAYENQPVMRRGGTPCYKCGGKYKNGGSYSGIYHNGTYFANGGPYVPTYGDIMNAQFGQDGAGELVPPGTPSNMPAFKNGGSAKYKKGGEYEMNQQQIQDLINKGYKIQYV